MKKKSWVYELKDVRYFYGAKKVLDIPGLNIRQDAVTGIIGPNGSGKSTLLTLLSFADTPDRGRVLFKGEAPRPFSPRIRSKIALLTQEPYLLNRTVFENLVYGLRIRKDTANLTRRAGGALSMVGLDPDAFLHRKRRQLSGGETRRIALAARLILKPEVLLLDEPAANVDAASAELIRKAVLTAREEWGTSLVIAGHNLQWLYAVCDTGLTLFRGKVFLTGFENIITGPFEQTGEGDCIKRLGDGRVIRLPAGGRDGRVAVISKDRIRLPDKTENRRNRENKLACTVLSMILEARSGRIMTAFSLPGLEIMLSMDRAGVEQHRLYPGKKVMIQFDPSSAKWI